MEHKETVRKETERLILQKQKESKEIKGLKLCEGFFNDCAKAILDENFPELRYSAGLIGYGSDVLGYDDTVSTDHMWGPRFYLFLKKEDLIKKNDILSVLSEKLPYTYEGYSVNFTEPDPNDCGVQHPKLISEGKVNPLIFIYTFEEYLTEQIGKSDLDHISPLEWLAFSEHRLLSLVSGKFFVDQLNCAGTISKLKYYPKDVKRYLIASNWECIASEQAFMKRCGACGDEIGSRIICARMAERLMRLCFLYQDTYAPYSKWFGTAFGKLPIDEKMKSAIEGALSANDLAEREDRLIEAQVLVADMHNASGLTDLVAYQVESYFGRDIKVIFADKFVEAAVKELKGTAFENMPLIGTFSQIGGLSGFADEKECYGRIVGLYGG
ncbi:MAG: DUF4037 domain-containing protein [Lachnospiraceae bacterium]|nr:DUF4037 domain-containing protein [Lachnospiraceae bacterium]